MRLGLFDMIGLATTLVFAVPLANFGVWRIMAGETAFGVALVGVAVAMVVLPQYFLDPARIARTLLYGLLPRRFRPGKGADADRDPET